MPWRVPTAPACVDLHARHYAGDIAEIGGTGAPALIVELHTILAHEVAAAVLDQLHEGRIMVLGGVTGTVAELNTGAHRQGSTGQGTVDLDVFPLDGFQASART